MPRHHLFQADCEVPTDARERGQAVFELALEAEAGAPEGPQQHMDGHLDHPQISGETEHHEADVMYGARYASGFLPIF